VTGEAAIVAPGKVPTDWDAAGVGLPVTATGVLVLPTTGSPLSALPGTPAATHDAMPAAVATQTAASEIRTLTRCRSRAMMREASKPGGTVR